MAKREKQQVQFFLLSTFLNLVITLTDKNNTDVQNTFWKRSYLELGKRTRPKSWKQKAGNVGEEEQGRANGIMMYMNETTMKSLYILTKIVFKRQGWFIIPFLSPNCSLHPGNSLVFINDEQQQILFLKNVYVFV